MGVKVTRTMVPGERFGSHVLGIPRCHWANDEESTTTTVYRMPDLINSHAAHEDAHEDEEDQLFD